jgi:hypothetical protein
MFKFAGTSGGSHTCGSRENSRAHARTDPADAQEYPENDRREKKVSFFLFSMFGFVGYSIFSGPHPYV